MVKSFEYIKEELVTLLFAILNTNPDMSPRTSDECHLVEENGKLTVNGVEYKELVKLSEKLECYPKELLKDIQ